MGIALIRIDERLIHGQVAYSWSKDYPADQYMVIDDVVAHDEFQKDLLEMAVPSGKKFLAFDTQEAIDYLSQPNYPSTFIVVKGPKVILDVVSAGVNISSINVGGMYFRSDRKEYAKTIYLNEEEVALFKQLATLGVLLDMRTAPSDNVLDLAQKL
ncbi:PTS system mannose/fructose/N-acetylgalactosamine-transporter subunit IIB [Lacticaseibacillus daqingensis]|uniref:PTS system mannose/fructose/N-acetylgalactosamine-transporter subunit IIB n=1 Tax=Lacticaseibacillus daqingensis TaxID=2486014 RepID=UPI000F78E268|nr:PTS sugar transporter subunit IIB [Lacticaseibacillus daqingensis]